jgi:Tfp pilus assembly protein PilE
MKTEHTIGVIIIILLAADVYFSYQNYLLNQEKNR